MEILITIAPILIVGVVSYFIISIQEWITDVRFYRRRTQKELDRIRASFCKVPIGELESDKVYVFSEPKVGTVTGTVGSSLLCNEELKEMDANLDEAEKLIKEAKEKKI